MASSTRSAEDQKEGVRRSRFIPETQGGMLTRGVWGIQTDAIIDIIFVDADADTYVKAVMDTLFLMW